MEIGTDVVTLSYFINSDLYKNSNKLVTITYYDSAIGKVVKTMSKSAALQKYGDRVVKKIVAGYQCMHYEI